MALLADALLRIWLSHCMISEMKTHELTFCFTVQYDDLLISVIAIADLHDKAPSLILGFIPNRRCKRQLLKVWWKRIKGVRV